jgi:myo-inositol-1(or 4)-monophosphatase
MSRTPFLISLFLLQLHHCASWVLPRGGNSLSRSNTRIFAKIDPKKLDEVLQVAIDASKKAGDIILGNAGGAEVMKSKANSRDLLTMIDPLCEKAIRETVAASFPDHDFLGEEDVPPGREASANAIDEILSAESSSDWLWIVDPIDGECLLASGDFCWIFVNHC